MSDISGVASTPLGSSSGGAKLTISAILKQPTFVRAWLLTIADQMFVSEKLFRHVQDCPSGTVIYYASTPLFLDDNADDLAEFEEIPLSVGGLGTPTPAIARRKGLGIMVSEQMRTRDNVDALNIQLMQARNTLVKDYDGKFISTMDAAVPTGSGQNGSLASHVVAAGTAWATSSTIRADIAAAAATVVEENRGFMPDSLLIDQSTWWGMLGNANAWQIYQGNVANLNPQLLGRVPGSIMGLKVFVTINGNITSGDAYLCQSNVFGGISDERPLTATPWYQNLDNETWRSNITRASAVFVDQPLALAKLTGVR